MIFYLYFLPSVLSFNFHPFINPTISISNLALSNLALKKVKQFDINPNITRKAIHIASAPTFISTWNLYNDNYPQFWASSVPLATSLYLITKKSFVSSVISRSGNTSEVLKGPLLYTFILSIMTLYYWTDNPIGLITMSQLSFGDGFADLVGRRYGKTKWIYNKDKSLEGTLGFFITSYIGTNIMISLFNDIENTHNLFLISLICSLVETIPFIDDNISIPLAVILISNYL
tara:strand:+ start:926 stop:1618 length:693 start_codon:yes stop_codon:yes gene_type:complete